MTQLPDNQHNQLLFELQAFARESSKLTREADIAAFVERIAALYGLSGFIILTVPPEISEDLSSCVIMSNWHPDLLFRYESAGLVSGSPVLDHLRKSTIPFSYDVARWKRADGKGAVAASLFERFGIPRGTYFPAHTVSGLRGAVGFCGSRAALTQREMAELNGLANLLFLRATHMRSLARGAQTSLSRRETECLAWASAGKTSEEMSKILGLSHYTINHYLNRASRKLDAVNRAQAVAKAVRTGLIN